MKPTRTVKTDTIEVWKAKIIEQEHIKELLEDIKAEINGIDSMTFIGNGSGCASEMRAECLKIIDKHIGKAESEGE